MTVRRSDSDMAARIRAFDWSATTLGAMESWSPVLRVTVELLLSHGFAMSLLWGEERLQIYNDAYRSIVACKHPHALGRSHFELWPEVRHLSAPIFARVQAGETVLVEEMLFPLARRDAVEDAWFTVSFSPVYDGPGAAAGILVTVFETTERVLAERQRDATEAQLRESEERQRFILALSDALRPLADPVEIQETAARLLGERLGADRTCYVQMDLRRQVGRVERDYVRGDVPSVVGEYPFASFPTVMASALAGRPFVAGDLHACTSITSVEHAASRALALRANVVIPLIKAGELVATMAALKAEPYEWTTQDIALVEETAERTWAAVERARAESALRRSEERWRGIFERMHEGFATCEIVYDAEGKAIDVFYLDVNAAWERLTGISREVILGRTAREALPGIEPCWLDTYARVVESGEPTHFECHLAAVERWFEVYAYRIEPGRFAALFLNVTERKRMEQAQRETEAALREREERLRQFGDASQDILWIRDAKTLQWQYLTPAFETVYGLRRDEVLSGDNYRSWIDLIVTEDRPHAAEMIRRARAGEHVTFEYRIRRPADGAIRWVRNTDFPITDATGEVVLVGGIGHDMTELREAERRLRTLIEGIPQLVWRAVDGGRWTWASPQWTHYTGRSDGESEGWGWLEALHPEDRAVARAVWSHAVERGGFEVEYRIRNRADGSYRWFQTRAAPVRDEAGLIVEWLGTSTDIDELRSLQDRQQVLVAELQHRTRNLMGVISAMADKTARASSDLADFRVRYHGRLEALARVQGLLSRLNEHDRVTFDALIRGELEALHGGAERVTLIGPKNVRLRSSTVQTLAMALHELATNAVKYGALAQPSARLTVTWALESAGVDGPWLHIDWRERGVAMPPTGEAPTGTGQGRELIERALPYQLNARTRYVLAPDGVHCTIAIPASASTLGAAAGARPHRPAGTQT